MKLHTKLALMLIFGITLLVNSCSDSSTNEDTNRSYSVTLEPTETGLGSGNAQLTFNTATRALSYTINWELSEGDTLTNIHFHGPADVGQSANIIHNIPHDMSNMKTKGTIAMTEDILTTQEANEFTSGKWYINIHSNKKPDGVLRGWVK